MSKLYNTYLTLKKQDIKTVYLFKNGIFFIALDDDAYTLSNNFNLKLSKLNDTIVKCGFPISSLDKYLNLFKSHNLSVRIIEPDNYLSYNIKEFKQNQYILELLEFINSLDINKLSIREAYNCLEDLKNKAIDINNLF